VIVDECLRIHLIVEFVEVLKDSHDLSKILQLFVFLEFNMILLQITVIVGLGFEQNLMFDPRIGFRSG
jgi:hypothetical protein